MFIGFEEADLLKEKILKTSLKDPNYFMCPMYYIIFKKN